MLTTEQLPTRYRGSLRERIEGAVKKVPSGCWIWQRAIAGSGYPSIRIAGRSLTASRVAYVAFVGTIPDAASVLHRCDEPRCVNPAHLFLGSHQDNMRDRDSKGRAFRGIGEKNPNAKLTTTQVRAIRKSQRGTVALARDYGVHRQTILRIRTGENWTC